MTAPLTDRDDVRRLVAGIRPGDQLEREHQRAALAWIDGGHPLWRTESPDVPDPHLVTYFVPYCAATDAMLLVDHRKARLWLPPGGHVEPGEDPRRTVAREAHEELGIEAAFHPAIGDQPLMITATRTRGPGTHTDITLWFLLVLDRTAAIVADPAEFAAVRWADIGRHGLLPGVDCEPHLHRFETKLGPIRALARSRD